MFTFEKIISQFLPIVLCLFIVSCSEDAVNTTSINGKVVYDNGSGVPSTQVSINGGSPVLTGADGSFTASTEKYPYDGAIVGQYDSLVTAYMQLSTVSPVLRIKSPPIMEQLDGSTLMNIHHPIAPAGKKMFYAVVCNSNPVWNNSPNIEDDTTFHLSIAWQASNTSVNATVVIIVVEQINGTLSNYFNYGTKQITLTESVHTDMYFSAEDLSPVPGQRNMQVSLPPIFQNTGFGANISFEGSYRWGILIGTTQAAFIPVPLNLGLPFNITVVSNDSTTRRRCSQTLPPGSNAQLSFGTDVNLTQPADGATGIEDRTLFSFDAGYNQGFYSINVTEANPYSNQRIQIYTKSPSFSISDIGRFSPNLNHGEAYLWNVTKIEGYSSLNDFVSWESFRSRLGTKLETESGTRTFTYGQ